MYCALDQVVVAAELMYALYGIVAVIVLLLPVPVEQALPEVVVLAFPVIVDVKFPAIVEIVLMLPAIAEQEQDLVVVELSFPVMVELALLVVVEMLLLFVVYARLNCLVFIFVLIDSQMSNKSRHWPSCCCCRCCV